MTMKPFHLLCLLCATGLSVAACSGKVDIAKENPDDDSGTAEAGGSSGGGHPPAEAGPGEGGSTGDDGGAWDGWSAGFASSSSGPPPTCASAALACGAPFPGQSAFASSQDAANALVGQWSFCGESGDGFYAEGQLGEEYAADGTYYELIMGSNGQLVRNMDPAAIGTWQVDLTPDNGLEVHTFGGNDQRSGGLSACPPSLVLLGVVARLD
jgi:hypothetical protein